MNFDFYASPTIQLYQFKESGLIGLQENTLGVLPAKIKKVRITYFNTDPLTIPCFSYNFLNQSSDRHVVYSMHENQGNNHSLVYFLKYYQK